MKSYNKFNFHKHSYCEFEIVQEDFFKENKIHYKSKSGSLYFYTKQGVYRYSNHWGRVGNCRWKISGVEHYKNQNYYVGYANWFDFFPLNSLEKEFYIQVFENGTSKIIKRKESTTTFFLMTLDNAFKRQKEIKSLFKNNNWAKYLNDDVEVVSEILIKKLISSNSTLQELKRSL
ncbi:hypothetical protein R3X25_07925 [Lutibacter sp. TH_r2]|uniref:hypothetical protein n=1 Tax=Lutibacter sp. TH_r2 TaxID=3082083 RepID=UPI002954059E|nr:hypothetical protein [Lutibacter sp. TH_r2]MDV7187208.1 hypothetical protein [Lutibacter sp. TH_r2]